MLQNTRCRRLRASFCDPSVSVDLSWRSNQLVKIGWRLGAKPVLGNLHFGECCRQSELLLSLHVKVEWEFDERIVGCFRWHRLHSNLAPVRLLCFPEAQHWKTAHDDSVLCWNPRNLVKAVALTQESKDRFLICLNDQINESLLVV